jgi:putative transposase
VLAFKERYNQSWIVERHGYRTPVQVRAEQLQPAALAA